MDIRSKYFMLMILLISLIQPQKRVRTDHWYTRNKQFEEEKSSIKKGGYVFLGNSITEGFDLEKYFPDWPVINRGIVADHIDGLLARLGNSAIDLKPSKLFLLIGINDIGDRRSDEYLKNIYTTLIDTLQRKLPETTFYILSILPTTAKWDNCPPEQIRRINDFLNAFSLKNNLNLIDLYPYFSDRDGYLKPDLTYDGLHLNSEGYDIFAKVIKKHINITH